MRKAVLILILLIGVIAVGMRVQGATAPKNAPSMIAVQALSPALRMGIRSLRSIHRVVAPVIDGDLSDWYMGESIDVNRDTAYSFSGSIDNTADLSATVRSGWSQDTLYFAIQVSDDVIAADDSEVWRDDGVEIGLDGLRDGQAWGIDDHQYTVVVDGRIADRNEATGDVVGAVVQHTGGYDVEIAIPMPKLIPGVPVSGTVMGFTVGVRDDDDGGNWDAYLIWEGTSTSSSPDQFGSLVFTERAEDRIALLEAKVAQLEQKVRELLDVLSEFKQVPPP